MRLAGGGSSGEAASPSPDVVELAGAAASAAVAWVGLAADDDPIPRSTTGDGNATKRAAHLLAAMCVRMATALASSRLAPGACVQLLDGLTHWLRGLASAYYEIGAQPDCSRHRDDASKQAPAARAGHVWACQAATAAARSAWWVANPFVRTCSGRSAAPYYRRWQWLRSGWKLAWAGADTPVPGAEPVASVDPPTPPLYPTAEEKASRGRAEAAARARGELPPPMVPDDVMVFVYTFSGRSVLNADMRRTWGAYVKYFVSFSTHEDPRNKAVLTRAPRPDWQAIFGSGDAGDGRNANFAPFALQHIYELGRARGVKYFINFDDDSVPLWSSLLAYLRVYSAAHGGRYPYTANGYDAELTNPRRLLYPHELSERLKARLSFDGGMGAPAGIAYAFSIEALHDFMGVIETCPITFQGDSEQGAIMACAGRGTEDSLTAHDPELRGTMGETFENYAWEPEWWGDPAKATLNTIYGLREDGTLPDAPGLQRFVTWHKVKTSGALHLLVDAYYAQYFGAPEVADIAVGDIHDGPNCTYAPPGEHLFTWGKE